MAATIQKVIRTYLQMLSREEYRPSVAPVNPGFRITEARVKQWELNRYLYVLVGSAWQWREKLSWTEEQWRAYSEPDGLRIFVAYFDGTPAGFYELKQCAGNEVELAYFGLAPQFIGRGLGGTLLSAAIEEAWAMKPARLWVHTCTQDHPNALKNYQARGFKAYRQVELDWSL